jgi:hypothetical protein
MKTLGRILIRNSPEVGIFVPLSQLDIEPGLYNLERNNRGVIELRYVGLPQYSFEHLGALSPTGLVDNREHSLLTEEEFALQFNKS